MRLISPSPGECVDRQTILDLKCRYGSMGATEDMTMESKDEDDRGLIRFKMDAPSKVNIDPFILEHNEIQNYLQTHWMLDSLPIETGEKYTQYLKELADVNEQVWKLTDQAHSLMVAPDKMQEAANKRAAEVLFVTTELNDKRASLVQRINGLFNINVQEKIFS